MALLQAHSLCCGSLQLAQYTEVRASPAKSTEHDSHGAADGDYHDDDGRAAQLCRCC